MGVVGKVRGEEGGEEGGSEEGGVEREESFSSGSLGGRE